MNFRARDPLPELPCPTWSVILAEFLWENIDFDLSHPQTLIFRNLVVSFFHLLNIYSMLVIIHGQTSLPTGDLKIDKTYISRKGGQWLLIDLSGFPLK